MDSSDGIYKLFDINEPLFKAMNLGFACMLTSDAAESRPLFMKSYADLFRSIDIEKLRSSGLLDDIKSSGGSATNRKQIDGILLHYHTIAFSTSKNCQLCALFLKNEPFEPANIAACTAFTDTVILMQVIENEKPSLPSKSSDIESMRNLQAKIFPSFEAVKELDIAAAYLPSNFMTGNFVDGFYIDPGVYQVVVCMIRGQSAVSTFAAASIRTLIRSYSSKNVVPSALINLIDRKLHKVISGMNSIIYCVVIQINTKTGKATLSSYGDLTVIYYNMAKKGYLNLASTETGKHQAKRNNFKDLSIQMKYADSLLYYSVGIPFALSEDGTSLYGEDRIIRNFTSTTTDSSKGIILSLINSVYEFTNYAPNSDDYVFINIKNIEKQ